MTVRPTLVAGGFGIAAAVLGRALGYSDLAQVGMGLLPLAAQMAAEPPALVQRAAVAVKDAVMPRVQAAFSWATGKLARISATLPAIETSIPSGLPKGAKTFEGPLSTVGEESRRFHTLSETLAIMKRESKAASTSVVVVPPEAGEAVILPPTLTARKGVALAGAGTATVESFVAFPDESSKPEKPRKTHSFRLHVEYASSGHVDICPLIGLLEARTPAAELLLPQMATKFKERFAHWMLQFPDEGHPAYVEHKVRESIRAAASETAKTLDARLGAVDAVFAYVAAGGSLIARFGNATSAFTFDGTTATRVKQTASSRLDSPLPNPDFKRVAAGRIILGSKRLTTPGAGRALTPAQIGAALTSGTLAPAMEAAQNAALKFWQRSMRAEAITAQLPARK